MLYTPSEMVEKIEAAVGLCDLAQDELESRAVEYADAEHAYKLARSMAMVQVKGSAADLREAEAYVFMVDQGGGPITVGDLRHRRDLADKLHGASLEAVRSRRTQLSAVQSIAKAIASEAEVLNYAGGGV